MKTALPRGDGGGGGFLDRVRWIPVVNAGGGVIPPHSLLEVTGTDADGRWTVDQPSADSLPNLLVSGPLPIAAGRSGVATPDGFVPVAYDDAHTPAVGEVWGSAANSWLLTKDKSGWAVVGDPDTERTTVPAARAAGGGTFGQTVEVVTKVCGSILLTVNKTFTDGYLSDVDVTAELTITNEKRSLPVADGVTIGDPYCVTNPTDCCIEPDGEAASLECEGCEEPVVLPLAWLNFVNKVNEAECLPDSIALTRVAAFATPGDPGDGLPGWIVQGSNNVTFFGNVLYCDAYENVVRVFVSCGETGVALNYIGAYGSGGVFVCGPLESGTTRTTADQPCDLFATPGTLFLGTMTPAFPSGSSVDVWLSWE